MTYTKKSDAEKKRENEKHTRETNTWVLMRKRRRSFGIRTFGGRAPIQSERFPIALTDALANTDRIASTSRQDRFKGSFAKPPTHLHSLSVPYKQRDTGTNRREKWGKSTRGKGPFTLTPTTTDSGKSICWAGLLVLLHQRNQAHWLQKHQMEMTTHHCRSS